MTIAGRKANRLSDTRFFKRAKIGRRKGRLVGQRQSGFGQVGFGGICRQAIASSQAVLVEGSNLGSNRQAQSLQCAEPILTPA